MEENFDAALLRFRDFLKNNGFPPRVVWLTPADVLLTGSELIYVHWPDQNIAQVAARSVFAQGLKRGNGVLLKGLFSKDSKTYSCIWIPKDRSEAEHALLPPLVKLAVAISSPFKLAIEYSDEKWHSLSTRYRYEQSLRMQLFE